MTIIDQVATALQDVLTIVAHRLARETGFVQRDSKLGGAAFVTTLVCTYLANPDATLDELTQTAAALDITISAPGLAQRFTPQAATFVQQVLAEAVTRLVAAGRLDITILNQFAGVFVEDSTVIILPPALRDLWRGCGNAQQQGEAALKLMVRLDLVTGLVATLSLHHGRVHDTTAAPPVAVLPPDSLYLADLGFFDLTRFQALAAQDSFFLARLQRHTAVFTADGQRWPDVVALLEAQGSPTVDLAVTLGVQQRVPARLVAVQAPQEVVDQRRRRMRAEAKRRGRTVSATSLALAAWTIFITNVPAARLPVAAVLVVARARWQIELLFKRWKSQGQIDESRSGQPWRVLCDVYAKLLAMLVQHWISLIDLWDYPDRSLMKAIRTIQKYAIQLAEGLCNALRTRETLATIARVVSRGCRMNTRKKAPNTYQLLVAVSAHMG